MIVVIPLVDPVTKQTFPDNDRNMLELFGIKLSMLDNDANGNIINII